MPKRSKAPAGREDSDIKGKIISAAEGVFARYGLRGASTAVIATAAGVSKPHIYYYFQSKEDLYREVLAQTLSLWNQSIPEMKPGVTPRAFLEKYIHARLEFSRTHPLLSRIFANEILSGAPILRPRIKSDMAVSLSTLAKLMEGWAKAGKIRPVDPIHFLFMIWAMAQAYADAAVQMELLLGKRSLDAADFRTAETTIQQMVFGALGLDQA